MNNVNKILQVLLDNNFPDSTALLLLRWDYWNVGGFAASLYKRGLKFINIPTTLLSADLSIGEKTGVNTKEGKNLIGSFYQPKLVISDTEFLKSLTKREIICGYGNFKTLTYFK